MADSSETCCLFTRYNLVLAVLLVLVGSTTTGWIMSATQERPVVTVAAPQAAQAPAPLPPEPVRQSPPLPPVQSVSNEKVEVLVAAKDLPVGTTFTRDDLKGDAVVRVKRVSKDALPPTYVSDREELVDKRLQRPIRAEETFNPRDVVKCGLTLPEGYDAVTIQFNAAQAAAGFIVPGSRVNIIATVRTANKLHAFPLLVNTLVVAVDSQNTAATATSAVSVAVTEKQALLLSLAKIRGCTLELMLRNPNKTDADQGSYDLDKVIKFLEKKDVEPREDQKEIPPAVEEPQTPNP